MKNRIRIPFSATGTAKQYFVPLCAIKYTYNYEQKKESLPGKESRQTGNGN
jgi:hypothetical protein